MPLIIAEFLLLLKHQVKHTGWCGRIISAIVVPRGDSILPSINVERPHLTLYRPYPNVNEPDYHQNLSISSLGHVPSFRPNFVKICRVVFSRNPVNKQIN